MSRQHLGSTGWEAGRRVARKDSDELGTIVEADGEIKVKWDRGRTSYYRRGVPANVQLADTSEAAQRVAAVDDAMDRAVEEGARPIRNE